MENNQTNNLEDMDYLNPDLPINQNESAETNEESEIEDTKATQDSPEECTPKNNDISEVETSDNSNSVNEDTEVIEENILESSTLEDSAKQEDSDEDLPIEELTEDEVCATQVDYSENFNEINEKLDTILKLYNTKIKANEAQEKMLKQISDENHEYKSDLYKKIMLPLVKEIIDVRNNMQSTVTNLETKAENEQIVPLASLATFIEMIDEAISNFDVRLERPQLETKPVSGLCRTIGTVKTDDEDKHGLIAQINNEAFFMGEKCIVPALVLVYKYVEPKNATEKNGFVAEEPNSDDSLNEDHQV